MPEVCLLQSQVRWLVVAVSAVVFVAAGCGDDAEQPDSLMTVRCECPEQRAVIAGAPAWAPAWPDDWDVTSHSTGFDIYGTVAYGFAGDAGASRAELIGAFQSAGFEERSQPGASPLYLFAAGGQVRVRLLFLARVDFLVVVDRDVDRVYGWDERRWSGEIHGTTPEAAVFEARRDRDAARLLAGALDGR